MNLERFITQAEKIIERYECNNRYIPQTHVILKELHINPKDKYIYEKYRDTCQQIVNSIWYSRDRR